MTMSYCYQNTRDRYATQTHLVDMSIYQFSSPARDAAHHTSAESYHHNDTPIHPSYYHNTPSYYNVAPTDSFSYSNNPCPPPGYFYDEEVDNFFPLNQHPDYVHDISAIHPAYRDHLVDSYSEPIQPHSTHIVDNVHPPYDDEEYYDDVTDEELAEINRRCIEYQRQMMEKKVEDTEDDTLRQEDRDD
jgi:hypothetical protein